MLYWANRHLENAYGKRFEDAVGKIEALRPSRDAACHGAARDVNSYWNIGAAASDCVLEAPKQHPFNTEFPGTVRWTV